jgi:hypothetical protein
VGTHIDGFFPYVAARSAEAAKGRLTAVFARLAVDLAVIRERIRHSSESGEWWLVIDDDGNIYGEGPSGFQITFFPSVAELTNVERFGLIEYPEFGVHHALRRVFEEIAREFNSDGQFAVAPGGRAWRVRRHGSGGRPGLRGGWVCGRVPLPRSGIGPSCPKLECA